MKIEEVLAYTGLVLVTFPILVYLSMKMGTYGYLRGQETFSRFKEKQSADNEGKESKTRTASGVRP